MSSSSLYKNNYKKLHSLKCLTATGKYDMLCKMARLSITRMKQFYKMLINNLSSPPVIRDSNPSVSRFHTSYDHFRWLKQEFMWQIARGLEAAVILSLQLFVKFELMYHKWIQPCLKGHSLRTTAGSLATGKVKDTAKLRKVHLITRITKLIPLRTTTWCKNQNYVVFRHLLIGVVANWRN